MACQFLEVLDFADLIHLIDDPVQYGFDLGVRLFLKEGALAFEPALVSQKFFLVESGDLLFLYFCGFHEGRNISLHCVSLQASFSVSRSLPADSRGLRWLSSLVLQRSRGCLSFLACTDPQSSDSLR